MVQACDPRLRFILAFHNVETGVIPPGDRARRSGTGVASGACGDTGDKSARAVISPSGALLRRGIMRS